MQLIVLLKKKVILTLIKVVGKTLLGTTATRGQYYCNRREIKVNSEYSKDKWGFTANE